MSLLSNGKKTKENRMPPLPVQLHEAPPDNSLPRAPQLPQNRAPRHPLAERAAEAAQYVIELEAERDRLRERLNEANSEIHFLRMTLEAATIEAGKLRDSRDYLVGLVASVKSRANMISQNLLDLMEDVTKTNLDAAPPVSEYAPRPKVDHVDMDRLSEQVVAEAVALAKEPLPEFLVPDPRGESGVRGDGCDPGSSSASR